MGTGIEGTLNHPFLAPGHTDNGAGRLVADSVIQLKTPH